MGSSNPKTDSHFESDCQLKCYCYIVECSDGTYYTGWTIDPERRVAVHNKGRGARYTKMRLPVKLVYVEELPDRNSAMKRERAIKLMKRKEKAGLIGGGKKVRKYTFIT